ncbi:hypothetical protein BDV29DRAFT_158908 [Aspergillus leporis]|uniref:Uncharacterized protein n=1 Tax=Aspergillus leporis TaxID=41062 RepID=A0A5N5WYD9_9EURO|nr:hypothetical protein BDV29DRAFT_158908 [Aspergillus leporis]
MASYEKIQQNEDGASTQSLLKGSLSGTRSSSDDDQTVVDRAPWRTHRRDRTFSGFRIVIPLLISLIITSSAGVLLLAWLVAHQTSPEPHNSYTSDPATNTRFQSTTGLTSCGTTSAEALAAGCQFDIFSFGWNPPECTDLQLYNTTLYTLRDQLEGAPAFFTSKGHPISIDVVENYGRGISTTGDLAVADDQEIRSSWEHYLVACAYGWQKVQRAAMRNWPLEEWSASYRLAKRCGPDLLTRQKRDSDSLESHLKPWFPMCGLEAEQMRKEIAAAY